MDFVLTAFVIGCLAVTYVVGFLVGYATGNADRMKR